MKQLVHKLSIFLTLAVLGCGLLVLPPAPKASATPDPNNLITDSVFENVNSMSVNQLDNLANSFASSCVSTNNHFATGDPHGWSYTTNSYAFGGVVSIGQAVDSIALNYNINPQVIYTTLQKEQSMITGSAGCYGATPNAAVHSQNSPCGSAVTPCTTACPYSGGCMPIAMSYGCPNYCAAKDEGFSMQLTLGTWLLRFSEERAYGRLTGYKGYEQSDENWRYSGPMTPGYRQRFASDGSTYYDGSYTTQDGVSTTITNGATASLYTYTPFFNGNNSFVNLFQNTFGFGSTLAGNCLGTESPLPYVQRYYNPRTYEHFYSAYACDTTFLQNLGYINEGPVFNTSPSTASYSVPVYRYYNPATGQHMWSVTNETQAQLDADGSGYHVEAGIVFYVAQGGMSGVHEIDRFYNPKTYLHFWAIQPSPNDISLLNKAGYTQNESAVFYSQ